MEEKTGQKQEVAISKLEPIIPLLQEYIGLPFAEPILECEAAKMEKNPEAVHTFTIYELVSQKSIEELFHRYFEKTDKEDEISFFLWIVANLYYSGNLEAYESYQMEFVLGQEEQRNIREEIAQLYSYVQKRKQLRAVGVGDYALPGKPIEFESDDKTELRIDNTNCWFEAMLEHYLFPICLPDVASDEDARLMWQKEMQVGRKSRRTVNAVIHCMDRYLHDQGVVDSNIAAPKSLSLFIQDFLVAMDLIDDPDKKENEEKEKEEKCEPWYKIQKQIPYFRKEGNSPQLFNVNFRMVSKEELSEYTPDQSAYEWLFYPQRYAERMKKKTIGARIDLLLSRIRDIFRKGVYKKEKKENTSQS